MTRVGNVCRKQYKHKIKPFFHGCLEGKGKQSATAETQGEAHATAAPCRKSPNLSSLPRRTPEDNRGRDLTGRINRDAQQDIQVPVQQEGAVIAEG